MTYFDLSTDPKFMGDFTSSLFLPHTDLDKFPSVAKMLKARPSSAEPAPPSVTTGGGEP